MYHLLLCIHSFIYLPAAAERRRRECSSAVSDQHQRTAETREERTIHFHSTVSPHSLNYDCHARCWYPELLPSVGQLATWLMYRSAVLPHSLTLYLCTSLSLGMCIMLFGLRCNRNPRLKGPIGHSYHIVHKSSIEINSTANQQKL